MFFFNNVSCDTQCLQRDRQEEHAYKEDTNKVSVY